MALARHNLTIQDEDGNIIDGASVEVRAETVGTPLATLKPNRDGSGTLANPFTASDGADAGFYVVGGTYQVRVYTGPSGAPTFERIWRYVAIGLAAEVDSFGDMYGANNLSELTNKRAAQDTISVHGADVASASTINLESATGDLVDVTGTTTITAITLSEGHERTVRFTGALTLTNGASLVLPGGANIATAAGDFAVFRGYGSGVVRCVKFSPIVGLLRALASSTDNAALRFDGTSGKTVQSSPLIIADTTGALSRSGGGGIPLQGSNGNTAAAAGFVGEIIQATITFAGRIAVTSAAAGDIWNSLSLTAGAWLMGGNVGCSLSAGTLTHMHADHGTGTALQTTPGGGSTTAAHVTSANPNGFIWPLGVRPYWLSATTTINSVITTTFSGGTAGVYGHLWAMRICGG